MRLRFDTFFLFLVILLCGNMSVAIENRVKFNFQKTIFYAIDNALAFDSAKRSAQISKLEESSSYARFWPSLNLSTTNGLQDQSPRVGNSQAPWSSVLGLTLTENIYDNGISIVQYQKMQLQRRQEDRVLENQRNKLCLDIATSYLKFSLSSKLLAIQKAQFILLKKQFDNIAAAFRQGIKTRKDYMRFRAQVSRADIDLVNSRNQMEATKKDLIVMIGFKDIVGEDGVSSANLLDFEPIDLDRISPELSSSKIEINSKMHIEHEILAYQRQISELEFDLVKKSRWPEINLAAGATYGSSQYLGTGASFSDNATTGWNVLLTLKYNLWDWGILSRNREIAAHQFEIKSNEQHMKALNLDAQIQLLKLRFPQLQENYRLSKELLAFEESNIDIIEKDYRNGKAGYLELIYGLKDLSDAQIRHYSAVSELRIAEYSVLYHQGKIYDAIAK